MLVLRAFRRALSGVSVTAFLVTAYEIIAAAVLRCAVSALCGGNEAGAQTALAVVQMCVWQ